MRLLASEQIDWYREKELQPRFLPSSVQFDNTQKTLRLQGFIVWDLNYFLLLVPALTS